MSVDSTQPLCQNYHDLATAYATNNPTELRAVATKHTDAFTRVRVSLDAALRSDSD